LNSYFNQPSNPLVNWPEVTVTGEWKENMKPRIILKRKPIIIAGTTTTQQQQHQQQKNVTFRDEARAFRA
jgi:hypothetical protein